MKMNIKNQKIIAERENRAWSQQHLSDASGLSLRTVQRIESTGRASKESVLALSSTLGINIQELISDPSSSDRKRMGNISKLWLGPLLGLVASVLYMSLATAEDGLKLDYVYEKTNGADSYKAEVKFLLLFDESVAADIRGQSRIIFHGREFGDSVELEATLYEYTNESETNLVGVSKATSEFGKAITFSWSMPGDIKYKLVVVPSRTSIEL